MHALSHRQGQILDYVVECLCMGEPPMHKDIAAEFGVSRQTATQHLSALVDKGWLRRGHGPRTLQATDMAWRRALAAEEQQAGRRVGGVGTRTAVALRVLARRVTPEKRQAVLEFALS